MSFLRRVRSLALRIEDRAVRWGLQKGNSEYTRFAILGWYRGGSNFLLSLLNSHPSIAAFSEVFFPARAYFGNPVYGGDGKDPALLAERSADPAGFLERVVFRKYPRRIQAVGFKVFYAQLVKPKFPGLEDWFANEGDLRVVHLKRLNLLRVVVSGALARRTGEMASVSAHSSGRLLEEAGPLMLDPEDCLRKFETITAYRKQWEERLAGRAHLDVVYEELAAAPQATADRVFAYLEVPLREVSSRLVRQAGQPLSKLVANYDEVGAALRDTPWAGFLE